VRKIKHYKKGFDDMKGFVDKNICIGCELCTSVCPDIFRMDDDGLAIAIDDEIAADLIESAKDAEDQCPVEAITIE
jgi:ferredoxin